MQKVPIPDNEEARLMELMDYLILGTPGEGFFDLITQLAANICDTPISLVTFIDRDRQWFKSVHGVDQSIRGTEQPRDVAFCAHTILKNELMEVKDALNDPRFSDNPLVLGDPRIRFYAGAPLTTERGYNLGALCVISDKPKELSENQKNQLIALSKVTIRMLDARRAVTKGEEENWRIQESNKIKEMLLANMSHELITPLNAIVGFAQLLESDLVEPEKAEKQVFVDQILDRSDYLLRMITNLLEFTSAELQNLEFHYERANIDEELDEAVRPLRKTMGIKKINFIIEEMPASVVARMDCYWFRQVITSYLSNAVEIAPIQGEIRLRLRTEPGNKLYLEIENRNSRIDLKDTEKLFSREEHIHSSLVKRHPGIGLNLMLVKKVIEAQGGTVGARNVNEKSCVFYATFCSDLNA